MWYVQDNDKPNIARFAHDFPMTFFLRGWWATWRAGAPSRPWKSWKSVPSGNLVFPFKMLDLCMIFPSFLWTFTQRIPSRGSWQDQPMTCETWPMDSAHPTELWPHGVFCGSPLAILAMAIWRGTMIPSGICSPVIKRGNWKSTRNCGFNRKITYR